MLKLAHTQFATQVARNPNFNRLSHRDVGKFRSFMPSHSVITDVDQLEPHNTDWSRKFVGQSKLMLKPSTTEQVSEILKHCNDRSLAVVPQGGNTSLVGGSVPVFDEIILNMGNMNKILNFDSSYGILSSEAGCILQDLQAHAQGHNTEFPIDLGAKGSCMIGGNLSTNAGGINFIKHNSLHANCIGLKAVLPNGDILDNMTTLRKDNTGYDLKQLFIGAEGTLGIITECAILCGPQAKNKNMVLLSCRTFEDVLKIQKKAKADLSDILRAFEFMDWESVDIVVTQSKKSNYPFTVPYKFFCLVETASSGSLAVKEGEQPRDPDLERLFNFIESDGVVPQDSKQAKMIWDLREGIAGACVQAGYCLKYDVSLSSEYYYDLVEQTRNLISSDQQLSSQKLQTVGYGHLADGNLHLNVSLQGYDNVALQDKAYSLIDRFVMDYVRDRKGSVSAEHGVGLQKTKYLSYSKSPEMIKAMRAIKTAFDPKGIMNPYKVLE